MLSRHASSLYWLGRYQERAEYLARHLQVKYFSTMDSTTKEYRDITLRSILFTSSGVVPEYKEYNESDVIWDVALNPNSQTSIYYYVKEVRENTKAIRNLVSNELWESVNKNYHFVNNFNSDYLKARGLYEFTHGVQENAASFHAKLDSTLLHDNVWAFIRLGVYLERIYQITRGLINTLIDIKALSGQKENQSLENYLWLITLQTLEATDMTKKIFNSSIQRSNTCEFLITNLDFPKSISFGFAQVNEILKKIKNSQEQINFDKTSLEFRGAKIASTLKYLDYAEIADSIDPFLENTLQEIIVLNDLIHQNFFDF